MSEEMRTLEAQMQQRFTSQIHKATTSTPGIDDLARGGPQESLRAYIKRFSKAILEISGLDDGTAREALKKGLRHRSLFKNEICARYPPTIQDALHRAKGFIELEEENERVERDLARTREELSKARDEREKNFRRECPRQQRPTEKRVERSTRRDRKRPFSPPKYALGISPSELMAHLKRQDFGTEGRSGGAVEEGSPPRIPYRKGERNIRTWWRAQRAKGGAAYRRYTLSSARPEDNRSHSWRLDI
ncbi:hypothetical protein TIFTF001_038600 [Ficus carica]|uniref:Retrotransposon gag domain-containing protein n=1 Tax=Ficus carica TaxID=3494 RepID=A0AA88EIV0_FICCA|nr:hypothetical protein TIFTF001_038600 [Ficus carica]